MAYQPKSYRKFVATAATATLVASAVAPAASAASFTDVADRYKDAVDFLVSNNVTNGVAEGQFGTSQNIKRIDAAVMVAKLLGYSSSTNAADAGFTDVPADRAWAVNALKEANVISGKTATTFGSQELMTRGEMAKVIAEAYDLTSDADLPFTDVSATFATYVQALYGNEITGGKSATQFGTTDNVTRGEFALFVHRAENVATPSTPKVVGVSAINATQVQVTFGVAVNETDAETEANYKINGVSPSDATLAADGKTVTLTFASASSVEVSSKVLVVEEVALASDANSSTEVYTSVFSYTDTVKPEVVSIESTTSGSTASTLTVKASEPILAATLKINGVSTPVNFGGTDTATVSGLSLDSSKAHTVEIINLTDKATTPNITAYTTKSVTPVVDTVKPTVTLSAQSDKTILVTFSKSMDASTVTTALVNGSVKDESLTPVTSLTAQVVPGTSNKQFTIDVTSTLFTNTNSRTLYVVLPNTITDSLGNKLDSTTQSVVLTKDTVKPAATGFSVDKDANGNVTKITVEFSEGLGAEVAGAVSNPTIIDQNGVLVSSFLGGLTSGVVNKGDKKVVYTATAPAKLTGSYTFNFSSNLVNDTAETPNNSDAFSYNYDFGTGTTATSFNLTSVTQTGVDGTTNSNIITVNFGTAVVGGNVANSATALSNYTLNGQALPAGTTITLNAAREVATISLPSGSIANDDSAAVFTATGIKSTAGALLNSTVKTVPVYDNTMPTLTAANVIGNTVYVTFDEALDPALAADANIADLLANYEITSGSTTVVAGTGTATASVVPNSGNKKVALTFTDTTGTNFDATQTITVETLDTGDLGDANGNSVKAGVKVTATK